MTDLHKAIEAARMLRANIAALVNAEHDGERQVILSRRLHEADIPGVITSEEFDYEHLRLSSDDLVIQDTFDGETTLERELEQAVKAEDDDKILVDGITARIDELVGRRDRLKRRIEARRGLVEQAMAVASWFKYETPCGTISLSKASPKIEVDDETQIPSQFFKRQDPVLDKTSLGKVLKERHKMLLAMEAEGFRRDPELRAAELRRIDLEYPAIPGAHLETGGVNLTIRRK